MSLRFLANVSEWSLADPLPDISFHKVKANFKQVSEMSDCFIIVSLPEECAVGAGRIMFSVLPNPPEDEFPFLVLARLVTETRLASLMLGEASETGETYKPITEWFRREFIHAVMMAVEATSEAAMKEYHAFNVKFVHKKGKRRSDMIVLKKLD